MNKSVFFALHLYRLPECTQFIDSLNGAARLLKEHGYTPNKGAIFGDPYIQKARNSLVQQFLETDNDILFFIADDVEFKPEDVLRVIEMPGDVVAGVYRTKQDKPHYPVGICKDLEGRPITREDGCISARRVQTGFLRINRCVFDQIILRYPGLEYYGIKDNKKVHVAHDFFPQGVHKHVWLGEDYAFCELWTGIGGEIWVVPDIDLTHYEGDKGYVGNYHEYLKRLPGGIDEEKGKRERVFNVREGNQSLAPFTEALPVENGRMVEVGVYTGEGTIQFAESKKFKTIYAVDQWKNGYNKTDITGLQNNMDIVETLFDERVANYDAIHKVKNNSISAVETFNDDSLDLVYIDADHDYEAVRNDIISWLPKIKTGGYISGHDYCDGFPGVQRAVDELLNDVQFFPDSSWMVLKE